MKKIVLASACLFLFAGVILAQSEMDALKYSKSDLNGTARYMSMGGAFGALGGDISALANNPAGIGVYRSSEFSGTANLSNVSTSTMWKGTGVDASNIKFNFNNMAYIGTFKPDVEGLVNFNFGIGFNRLKDFYRNYQTSGKNLSFSLTDYISTVTNNNNHGQGVLAANLDVTNSYSGYDNYPWISVLGWNSFLIDPVNPSNIDNNYKYKGIGSLNPNATLKVSERGNIDEYNISFGGNIYDVFYFGTTIGITDLNYRMTSNYSENLGDPVDYTLNNYLETRGSGIDLKAGVILRPIDFFRFGLAVHTPIYYKLTDYYDANVRWNNGTSDKNTSTPLNSFSEYSLRTPFKMQVSSAFIFGKKGVLSFEYEYVDYSNMSMKDPDGYGWAANDYIQQDMGPGHNIKIGGEFRLTPQFSLRGGYANQASFIKTNVLNQNVEVDVFGSTLPHYTLDKGATYFTGGFGYRFGNYFTDFAFVSRQASEDVYAFSPIHDGTKWNVPDKATLKTTTNQILFTFGVKF
ncbi:MAG: hypothetical protein PHV20_10875 [Bacteroidales bacterium]|nr:hypothetical protein [Bacteroidales bacterium]